MSTKPSAYEELLVLRAQDGEQRALGTLVNQWHVRLSRYAQHLTGDAEGTAEVMQEVWLSVVRSLHRLEDPARFRPWVYRIVANKCTDWVRHRVRSRGATQPLGDNDVATEAPVELHLGDHGAVHSVKDPSMGERTVVVPCLRLDGYLAEKGLPRIDLLKLDVEGSEADVIEGLGERLADVSAMVGEMHTRLVDAPALYRRLEDAGFRLLHQTTFKGGEDQGVHGFEMTRG